MFSRAKRFNYAEPEPKGPKPKPVCQRCTRQHTSCLSVSRHKTTPESLPSTSTPSSPPTTPFSTPKRRISKLPRNLQQTLNQFEDVESRILNRCETMDNLCRDLFNSPDFSQDDEFVSLGYWSEVPEEEESEGEEEGAVAAVETPFIAEGVEFENFVDVCAEKVACLVVKRLEEKQARRTSLWKSTKSVLRDLIRPKVVDGEV